MPRSMRRAFPPVLSFVAGYVDGCTYLALFELFVAQVTGSFVLAGAQLVTHDPDVVVKVVGIPVYFLAGFVTTVMIKGAERRGRYALPAALTLEAALLMCLMLSGPSATQRRGPIRQPSCLRVCQGFRQWACRAHWSDCWSRALPQPM